MHWGGQQLKLTGTDESTDPGKGRIWLACSSFHTWRIHWRTTACRAAFFCSMSSKLVNDIAARFTVSQPAISKHLRILEEAGLVTRSRQAQRRPCRLQAEPLQEVADWLEGYRRHWEGRLDRLERHLDRIQKRDRPRG